MNEPTIFTVTNDDLGRFDERTAVDFFRRLLWAEARRIGIEISKINVPSDINTPDDGIDANVDESQITAGSGIIQPGKTSYQIKSGNAFKPWQKSEIKKELFGTKTPESQNLGESIHDCLEAGGTYILVCTGIDLVEPQRRNALNHIKNYLEQCDYPNPKVEVWSQNTLCGFLKIFPSLALQVNGRGGVVFQTHRSWTQDANMRFPFVSGQSQNELIASIQNELRQNNDTVHVRILGEPGIGKTKLALEATRTDDLSPLVIYCPASQFRDSFLMNELLRDDNQFSTVLVIDECDLDSRSYIWNKLRHRGTRIKLITIYNDYEEKSGDIIYYDTPPLEDEQIRNIIIREYQIPADQANRWAELCDGSPRVAHVIGQNLLNNREDLLKPPSTVDIWERYIVGRANSDTQEIRETRRVLRYIALFKRFGFERFVTAEAQAIAQKVGIEWDEFQEIVDDLKNRKILQGEFTLYITPKLLHIKLWTEWWDIYGRGFDLEEFTRGLTPELFDGFCEMFRYAAESEAASRVVEDLLGPNGPFQNDEDLKNRLGSRFFLALTEASPKSALRCLMRIMKNWNKEDFLHFTEGRREVVWALEKIAIWKDLFADAARLLLALGEAENEDWSNNASGVFAGLFSPAYSRGAPTEAAPADRFPILKEAFESGSKDRRLLALEACKIGLQPMRMWRRTVGAEYQGLRPEPKQWEPETKKYGELWEVYRQVWQLLFSQLERLPADEREKGAAILLEHTPELGRIPTLVDMIVDTLGTLAKKTYVNEKQVIATINSILFRDGKELPAKTRQRWEQLMNELVGSDFHSMMQRYVGMNLLEDEFDEDGNHANQAQPQIEKLAQQAVDTVTLLQAELHWLVTSEAQNGYRFGHELGKRDDGFTLLSTLLDAQRNAATNANVSFLGGYFRAIFDKDQPLWEEQLDALIEDTKLNIAISALTRYSRLTDQAGLRLLNLATNGIIDVKHLGIFSYGKATENLSEEVFTAWIEFLLSARDKFAASIALTLYYYYYVCEKPEPVLPRNLTFRLLVHPTPLEKPDGYMLNSMTDYYWTEIGKAFLQRFPEKSLELVEPMLSHFGQDGSIFGVFSQTYSILNQITGQHPAEVWEKVSRFLEDQTNVSRAVSLEQWLGEGGGSSRKNRLGALTLIPPEKIWEWVDKDIENRAWYVAYRLMPKTLSAEEWPTSLVRAFLIRYGEREDVRTNLRANYSTEMWQGSLSLHYENKQQKLLRLKDGEDNENVKRWIDKFVEDLEKDIEHAKIDEERE